MRGKKHIWKMQLFKIVSRSGELDVAACTGLLPKPSGPLAWGGLEFWLLFSVEQICSLVTNVVFSPGLYPQSLFLRANHQLLRLLLVTHSYLLLLAHKWWARSSKLLFNDSVGGWIQGEGPQNRKVAQALTLEGPGKDNHMSVPVIFFF